MTALSSTYTQNEMQQIITGTSPFDPIKAVNGESAGFVTDRLLDSYVTNIKQIVVDGVKKLTGIEDATRKVIYFDNNGKTEDGRTVVMIVDAIAQTSDNIGVKGGTTNTYEISSLLPRDMIAMNILNAMIGRYDVDKLMAMSLAQINQMSQLSYLFAQSMVNVAANNREELGKTDSSGSATVPDSKTEEFLKQIGDNIKVFGTEDKGLYLNTTTPLNIKPQFDSQVLHVNVDNLSILQDILITQQQSITTLNEANVTTQNTINTLKSTDSSLQQSIASLDERVSALENPETEA